jgi:DNA-binding MarR family transcriptional regulator
MSPSLLSKRLEELEEAEIVEKKKIKKGRGFEYHITDSGKELAPIVMTLGEWGQKFILKEFSKHELDPTLLMWDIQRRLDTKFFPKKGRFVARFFLEGAPQERRTWWLVIENQEVDLCVKCPGYEEDFKIEACLRALTEIWMGQLTVPSAKRNKLIKLSGDKKYTSTFADWFLLSPFASFHPRFKH